VCGLWRMAQSSRSRLPKSAWSICALLAMHALHAWRIIGAGGGEMTDKDHGGGECVEEEDEGRGGGKGSKRGQTIL
jgi:hypothetical protein